MNNKKQSNEAKPNPQPSSGMSRDDLSMLNQVLQQVKGISGVSGPVYDTSDTAYNSET